MQSRQPGFAFYSVLNHGSKLLLMISVIAICFVFFNYVRRAELFPIRTVKVFGIQHLSRAEVKESLAPLLSHGFFNVDVDRVRDHFSQLAWVNEVVVRRHWPDRVDILLREKQAVAVWNNQALLSESGRLFTPERMDDEKALPMLTGPQGQQLYLLGYYNAINRLLLSLHAKIKTLSLSVGGEWVLVMQNDVIVRLGDKDILTQLQHFVKVYPKIIGDKSNDVDYVDLRYPGGMAVRWKS